MPVRPAALPRAALGVDLTTHPDCPWAVPARHGRAPIATSHARCRRTRRVARNPGYEVGERREGSGGLGGVRGGW